MSRILSIDPGITTGIAIYDEEGSLEASITATADKIYKNGFLNKLVALSHPNVVIVESLPKNNVHEETNRLFQYLRQWFEVAGYDLRVIKPAQWKGLVKRVEIPGQHARDAATMAAWFIQNQDRE
jgi:predicted RNase H-like nuclease (RuvC/YqgF family)